MSTTTQQHTTAWLLDRARGGDRGARSALVARIEPLLRRFAHGRIPQLLRHREDTGDLVQLTWAKVLGHTSTPRTGSPTSSRWPRWHPNTAAWC